MNALLRSLSPLTVLAWLVPVSHWPAFTFAFIGFTVVTILREPNVLNLVLAILIAVVIFNLTKPSKEQIRAAQLYEWPASQNQNAEASGACSLLQAFLTSAAMVGLILNPIGFSAKWLVWLLAMLPT